MVLLDVTSSATACCMHVQIQSWWRFCFSSFMPYVITSCLFIIFQLLVKPFTWVKEAGKEVVTEKEKKQCNGKIIVEMQVYLTLFKGCGEIAYMHVW
ncbi:hypothetical protein VNO80_22579 [Phaseolus coccineus]|uniref:Uncharacterized protein n=1 Tax=Phaseolus coccineus TaxID=3886 RepID=A0AAN9M540_PHACN